MIQTILVGGLEHGFYFPPHMECHSPNWRTPSFFRGVGQPPTSNDYSYFQDVDITMEVPWSSSICEFPPAFVDHVPFSAATYFSILCDIFLSYLSDLFFPFLPQKLFFFLDKRTYTQKKNKKNKKHIECWKIQWSTYSFPTFYVFPTGRIFWDPSAPASHDLASTLPPNAMRNLAVRRPFSRVDVIGMRKIGTLHSSKLT